METAPNGRNKPEVQLSGQDGNDMNLVVLCRRAMKDAGWSKDEVTAFSNEGIPQTPDPAPGTEIRGFLTPTEDACTGQRNGI